VWQLISTWDRQDGSVTRMYVRASSPSRWIRERAASIRRGRRERERRRDEELGLSVGRGIIATAGPIAERHGLTPADPQVGDSVIWCSPAVEVRLHDRDDADDPHACVDLWVDVDRRRRVIAVDLEGNGLAEFVSGRSHWDGPIEIDLANDLSESLTIVAEHLDRMCDAVIVHTM
jgi:hypothetical protein